MTSPALELCLPVYRDRDAHDCAPANSDKTSTRSKAEGVEISFECREQRALSPPYLVPLLLLWVGRFMSLLAASQQLPADHDP